MLSTVHEDIMLDVEKPSRSGGKVKKPACVVEQRKKKKTVEGNMLISCIKCVRKTTQWYIKLFLQMLEMSLLNAFNMHLAKTGKKPSLLDFSKEVIHQLIARYYMASATAL